MTRTVTMQAECGEIVVFVGYPDCHWGLKGRYLRIPESELIAASDPKAVIANYASTLVGPMLADMKADSK